MKKGILRCVIFALLTITLTLCAHAEDTLSKETDEPWQTWLDTVPKEVAEFLPDSFFSQSIAESEEGVAEGGSVQTVLNAVLRALGLSLGDALRLLAKICGLLVLSAVFRSLSPEDKRGLGRALSLCSTLALSLLILASSKGLFTRLDTYFTTIKGVATSFLPLMGTLYAMGGNVRAAAVNHSVMSAFLVILETLCAGSVMPIAGVCTSLSLLDAGAGTISLRPLSAFIKRTYTLTLSFLMLLLCGVLGLQSTLAKASDTMALRTARFAAGHFLPVVGGSVAAALRSVAASVEYLRGVAGTGVILVLFYAFLPTFLFVLLTRAAFLLGGAIAKLLRCDSEEKILAELGSVFGYFLAVISSLFVMLVFSLTLFARAAAVGR